MMWVGKVPILVSVESMVVGPGPRRGSSKDEFVYLKEFPVEGLRGH